MHEATSDRETASSRVVEPHKKAEEDRLRSIEADLIEKYDSPPSPDGYCGNKQVVQRIIAALCAYDDQLLGKVLSKIAIDHHSIDLTSERQARRWLEQRIRLPDGFTVPGLLCVLDQVIMAYKFRQPNQLQQLQQSTLEPTAANLDRSIHWDSELEVQDWKAVLDWLSGKCTFCAGRGLSAAHISHTLRQCKRGGRVHVYGGLGRVLYNEGLLPSFGCEVCCLPRRFCSRWDGLERRGWSLQSEETECSYSRYLLCDGIIGFAGCGVQSYEDDLFDGIEAYFEKEGGEPRYHYDDEFAAAWLAQPLEVAGIEGSEMIRQLSIWTQSLDEFKSRTCSTNSVAFKVGQSSAMTADGENPAIYQSALKRLIQADTQTEWVDGKHDVPAVRYGYAPGCERWLRIANFLQPGKDDHIWGKIKRNWIAFLAATSSMPNSMLAPRRMAGLTSPWLNEDEAERERRLGSAATGARPCRPHSGRAWALRASAP